MASVTEPIHVAAAQHPSITIQTKKSHNTLFDTSRPGVKYDATKPTLEQAEALRRLFTARANGRKIDDPKGVDSSADAGYGKGL